MPVNKNAAFRHRIIDGCLRNTLKQFPSIEDLRNKVTEALNLENIISKSSIDKDLKAMKEFYKAPIAYDSFRKGYYYTDKEFSINSFPLTEEEIRVLDLSTSFLKQIKYSGYFEQFESVIEKLISGFRLSRIPGYEKRKFIELEEPIADSGLKWLEQLYQSILNKQTLGVTYKRFNQEDIKEHIFSNYAIREYRNRWYCVGFSERAKTIITLALDRIMNVEISNSKYKSSKDFDESEYFKYSFGVTAYTNASPYKIKLLFNQSVASYILTKPLHLSQKTILNEKGLEVEIECYLTPELEMMILGYGENVLVIEPNELIERVNRRINAMSYLYDKK